MFLPLHSTDHRIGPSPFPFEERRILRRSSPEHLRFDLPAPGTPAPSFWRIHPPEPIRPPSGLRVRLGRLLIAWGQRLAAPAHAP